MTEDVAPIVFSCSDKHNVFLSFSGTASRAVAETLYKYLPRINQHIKPWMSSENLGKGSVWTSEIVGHIRECTVGIICVTPDNLTSPWLLFEAGALGLRYD